MDLSKQLERAREAVSRGNDEYAVQLYQDLLALEPANLQARKELLEASVRKYRKLGIASAGQVAALTKGLMPMIKANVYGSMRKFDHAMAECEKYLALSPSDRGMRKTLARCAKGAGYTETAIWVYEWLADTNKKDAAVFKALAELYRGKGDIDTCVKWYERFKKLRPDERGIDALLRDLDAERTMTKSGWSDDADEGGFKKVLKSDEESQDLADKTRLIRTKDDWDRQIDRLTRELEANPGAKKLVIQIAETYHRGAEFVGYVAAFTDARKFYNQAREIDAADLVVVERLEDLRIDEYDYQIAELKEKEDADEADAAKLKELEETRGEYALKSFVNRVQNRPTDTTLRFHLAELYYLYGETDQALQQYQHAVRDPKVRKHSLNRMGECLMRKGIYDMAIARFEEAVKGIVVVGPDEKKILYNLGNAAEKAGDTAKAEDVYKKIYESDITFKDVAQKIEDIYKRRSTG